MISFTALVLVISIGFLVPKAAAQSDKYPKMAPVDQYLMERNAEILLARSAAPDSIPATRRSWSWDGKAMKQLSENCQPVSVIFLRRRGRTAVIGPYISSPPRRALPAL
jgi:hypothetical protein